MFVDLKYSYFSKIFARSFQLNVSEGRCFRLVHGNFFHFEIVLNSLACGNHWSLPCKTVLNRSRASIFMVLRIVWSWECAQSVAVTWWTSRSATFPQVSRAAHTLMHPWQLTGRRETSVHSAGRAHKGNLSLTGVCTKCFCTTVAFAA